MKKIKTKITEVYGRYLIFVKNSIIKNTKKIIVEGLISFFSLNFLKSKNVKTSILSRYLISLIVLLFTFLFYLSIPTIYNYSDVQKYLNDKLLNEFNLNTSLSANITYKILPTPNFEISNVLLSTGDETKPDDFAQIKKMNIYLNVKNLYNQKKIQIKKISISEANIDINKKSFKYINNYLNGLISNKKILIKKSKLFFREDNNDKNVIVLSPINSLIIFHDIKNNVNKINFNGSIFNTNYNFLLLKNLDNKNITDIQIKFKDLNALINSKFVIDKNNKNIFYGQNTLNFSGSKINTQYKIEDKLISFKSENSKLNNKDFDYSGEINIDPFYYNINLEIDSLNAFKTFDDLSNLKNLVNEKILLNKKFNGKLELNIDNLKGLKFFDKALIKTNIINGKLILNDSYLKSNKIGKLFIEESGIQLKDNKRILKLKMFYQIFDQKKFYQKLQIPKNVRINLNNIYFELENHLDIDEIILKELVLNKKTPDKSINKSIDLTNNVDINEIIKFKNWIELKKFSNQIFSKIDKN